MASPNSWLWHMSKGESQIVLACQAECIVFISIIMTCRAFVDMPRHTPHTGGREALLGRGGGGGGGGGVEFSKDTLIFAPAW